MRDQINILRDYQKKIKNIEAYLEEKISPNTVKEVSEDLRESYYNLLINQFPDILKEIYEQNKDKHDLETIFPRILLKYSNSKQDKLLEEINKFLQRKNKYEEFTSKHADIIQQLNTSIQYIINNQTNFFKRFFLNRNTKQKLKESQTFVEENKEKLREIEKEALKISEDLLNTSEIKLDFQLKKDIYYQEIKSVLNFDSNQEDVLILFFISIVNPIKIRMESLNRDILEQKIIENWDELKKTYSELEINNIPVEYLKVNNNLLQFDILYRNNIYKLRDLEYFLKSDLVKEKLSLNEKEHFMLALAKFKEEYIKNIYPKIDIINPNQTEIDLLRSVNLLQNQARISQSLISEIQEKNITMADFIINLATAKKIKKSHVNSCYI